MGETASTASNDGEKTQRRVKATCCGCMSLHRAILLLTIGGLGVSVAGTILYAMRLADNLGDMHAGEILVTGFWMAMWIWLIAIMLLGLYAVWKEHSRCVEAYFWLFISHWICDFGIGIGFLAVMWQIKGPIIRSQCAKIGQDCTAQMVVVLLLITSAFAVYKLFGLYVCYLLFCYRSVVLVNNDDVERPPLTSWLSKRSSTSSESSVFARKKLWSPSRIPNIKIDFASDQSSASTYSNEDSASYREVVFGYSKLQTPPPVLHASHPGGSTLNYSYAQDGNGHMLPYQHPPHSQDNTTLPGYSVVGSSKGVLT